MAQPSSARSAVLFRTLAAVAVTLSCAQADAVAQDRPAVSVASIDVDGTPVSRVDGVRVTAPGAASAAKRALQQNDALAPGTVIEVPDRTVVTLVTTNGTVITLQPGSRTKLNAIDANGESITHIFGEVWFKVTRALSFFEVTHDRFLAAVKGTEFTVATDGREIQFVATAGRVAVSRDVKIRIEGEGQRESVTVMDYISAENQRVRYPLNVEEYLRDFQTYQDVEEYFRRQVEAEERSGDQLRLLQAWTNLGTALMTIGKARDAIGYFDRSLALNLQLHPDGVHPAIAGDYGKLGLAWSESGDPRRAIGYYEQSLALLLRLYPDGVHPDIAAEYTNLGVAYGQAGEPRKAIAWFEQSLALLPRLYPDPEDVRGGTAARSAMAANLGNLGTEYGRLKEPRKAIEYFERALALHLALYPGGVHPDIAIDYNNLGVQYLYLRDLPKAIDTYERSLALLLQLFPDGAHPAIAQVYRNLHSAWRARGDVARADDYARRLKEIEARLKR